MIKNVSSPNDGIDEAQICITVIFLISCNKRLTSGELQEGCVELPAKDHTTESTRRATSFPSQDVQKGVGGGTGEGQSLTLKQVSSLKDTGKSGF